MPVPGSLAGCFPQRAHRDGMEVLGEAKSRSERTDRSTALRQLLYAGAEDYAMELLAEERISSGKAAELLDTTMYRIHGLAAERGMEIGARLEDYQRSKESTAALFE